MSFHQIIQFLDSVDRNVTLSINSWNSPFFDTFFYTFTQTYVWMPLAVLLLFVMYKQWHYKSLYVIMAIALAILLADQISSSFFKPLVERLRPTHNNELSGIIHTVNGYRGGLYGFVSSHAANSVAFVILTSLLFRHKAYALCFTAWAFFTAYSRIYLGVHYFGDVLCGAMVGAISAFSVYYLFIFVISYLPKHKKIHIDTSIASTSNLLMICALMATILIIALYSAWVNFF